MCSDLKDDFRSLPVVFYFIFLTCSAFGTFKYIVIIVNGANYCVYCSYILIFPQASTIDRVPYDLANVKGTVSPD